MKLINEDYINIEKTEEEVKAYLAKLKYALVQSDTIIKFQNERQVDKTRSLKYTNAYTSTDQTVYINNIPANVLSKWLMLESERFSELVLRLFHTELEAVYEEFNMGQDRDGSRVYQAMLSNLFDGHTYSISTIGVGEHLKNPSHVAIHNFFDTYYVPNNMAICLSGDLDPSETIKLIEKSFGSMKTKKVERPERPKLAPITKPIETEIVGKEAESVNLYYRFDKFNYNHYRF